MIGTGFFITYMKGRLLKYLGVYMFKRFLIGFILPTVVDALIAVLHARAKNTKSKVDDKLVAVMDAESEEIVEDIKRYFSNA
jgi:hypothetical protein